MYNGGISNLLPKFRKVLFTRCVLPRHQFFSHWNHLFYFMEHRHYTPELVAMLRGHVRFICIHRGNHIADRFRDRSVFHRWFPPKKSRRESWGKFSSNDDL